LGPGNTTAGRCHLVLGTCAVRYALRRGLSQRIHDGSWLLQRPQGIPAPHSHASVRLLAPAHGRLRWFSHTQPTSPQHLQPLMFGLRTELARGFLRTSMPTQLIGLSIPVAGYWEANHRLRGGVRFSVHSCRSGRPSDKFVPPPSRHCVILTLCPTGTQARRAPPTLSTAPPLGALGTIYSRLFQ
jgi:hypothetical protein